jgi:activator of HSP90 ATPase
MSDVSTITLEVGFRVPAHLLYEALTDAKLVSGYTQSPAIIDAKFGGTFSLFNGAIAGKYTSLVRDASRTRMRREEGAADELER